MRFLRLGALLALAGVASAHFQLTYPPSRGFVEVCARCYFCA